MPAVQLLAGSSPPGTGDPILNPLPHLLQTPSGLAIVEIQGTIRGPFQDSIGGENSAAKTTPIGRLEFPLYDAQDQAEGKWMKKVYLYVGKHQRLTGEVKKLAKPLAVIRKIGDSEGSQADSTDDQSSTDLEIVDIINFRLLFSGRPEPVGE